MSKFSLFKRMRKRFLSRKIIAKNYLKKNRILHIASIKDFLFSGLLYPCTSRLPHWPCFVPRLLLQALFHLQIPTPTCCCLTSESGVYILYVDLEIKIKKLQLCIKIERVIVVQCTIMTGFSFLACWFSSLRCKEVYFLK